MFNSVLFNKVRYALLIKSERDDEYKYIGSLSNLNKLIEIIQSNYKDKDFKIYKKTDNDEDITEQIKSLIK